MELFLDDLLMQQMSIGWGVCSKYYVDNKYDNQRTIIMCTKARINNKPKPKPKLTTNKI